MNSSDHDILITLVETVKNNHKTTLEKMDGIKVQVTDIKDGIHVQLSEHEQRIKDVEKLCNEISNINVLDQVRDNTSWINQYKTTYKTIIGLSIFLSSAVSFILGIVASLLQLFKKI